MPEKASQATQIFAINYAALAREIAMDILPLNQILELHRLTDEDWQKVQSNQAFQQNLSSLVAEWNSATSVRERMKIKAATALEAQLEVYVLAISDDSIPLIQRVEAGKFLARLGELDGLRDGHGVGSDKFVININIGNATQTIEARPVRTIDAIPVED
jgi:hypothetical protein